MFGNNETPETRLKKKFWKDLQDDRTVMLGHKGVEDDLTRPMTAQVDVPEDGDKEDGGPIYFFASRSDGVGLSCPAGDRTSTHRHGALGTRDHGGLGMRLGQHTSTQYLRPVQRGDAGAELEVLRLVGEGQHAVGAAPAVVRHRRGPAGRAAVRCRA